MRRRSNSQWMILLLLGGLLALGSVRSMVAAQATQPAPVPTAQSPIISAQGNAFEALVFDTRADLDVLATTAFKGTLPATWTGNTDVKSRTVVADLWFDNEHLADQVFGVGNRPPGWLGANGNNAALIARNVRHDLELTANQVFGITDRPGNWRGAAPLLRCDVTVQNAVSLLATFYNTKPTTPESALNYCSTLASEVEDKLAAVAFTPDQLATIMDRLLAVRGDLERLADEKLGLNNRPSGWVGNKDKTTPTFSADLFLDQESLTNELIGKDQRPPGWIGAITNSPPTTYLNLRHDLELLADNALGVGQRPNGWQGGEATLRCDPLVQNVVTIVTLQYNFVSPQIDANTPNYCTLLAAAANQIAENPPVSDVVAETDQDKRQSAVSNYAFAYLDFRATQYMGIMPAGIKFKAWYRNFHGSKMMFVTGDNFAVYVDYSFTTLPPYVFDALPSLQGVNPQTFCNASWCNGPGPTPTPTGEGPLGAVLGGGTQPAVISTPGAGTPNPNKTKVSWNNIRVTYIQDNTQTRTAQVTIELCTTPAATATVCEPVISVIDGNTNQILQPLAQNNGANVYEFKYGYSTGLQIEGDTLYSNDIWISDPTIR